MSLATMKRLLGALILGIVLLFIISALSPLILS